MTLDHVKKYMRVGGHLVELSFTDTPNKELFDRIRTILLNSHICNGAESSVRSSKKEVEYYDG